MNMPMASFFLVRRGSAPTDTPGGAPIDCMNCHGKNWDIVHEESYTKGTRREGVLRLRIRAFLSKIIVKCNNDEKGNITESGIGRAQNEQP